MITGREGVSLIAFHGLFFEGKGAGINYPHALRAGNVYWLAVLVPALAKERSVFGSGMVNGPSGGVACGDRKAGLLTQLAVFMRFTVDVE